MTDKDVGDLKFGVREGFDWAALSFVRSADDAGAARKVMDESGRRIPLIAKIEKRQAIDDIDRILDSFDGLMIARGDLGIELPIEEVPGIQKELIRQANRRAKPVITATQMLLSMVQSPTPTRAEASDVANAVLDGSDAVMLSEETAVGRHPVEAVAMIARICARAETLRPWIAFAPPDDGQKRGVAEGIAKATHDLARTIGAALIITPTTGGSTPALVASARPKARILALSSRPETVKRLALTWGVEARLVEAVQNTDQLFEVSRRETLKAGLAAKGDRVVITTGIPFNSPGSTNLVQVIEL